jgi:hypothetical protein
MQQSSLHILYLKRYPPYLFVSELPSKVTTPSLKAKEEQETPRGMVSSLLTFRKVRRAGTRGGVWGKGSSGARLE